MSTIGISGGEGRLREQRVLQLARSVVRGSYARLAWRDWPFEGHVGLAENFDEVSVNSLSEIVSVSEKFSAPQGALDLYQDVDHFREAYQLGSLFSKYPFDIPGIDRERAALVKLEESEQHCDEVNARLFESDTKASFPWERSMLRLMRRKIERILGDNPFPWALKHVGFGPGASVSLPSRKGDAYYKFGNPNPTFTKNLTSVAGILESWSPLWGRWLRENAHPNQVVGNKVTTVPKNSKVDRCIAIEPDLNCLLQKGIGGVIRDRLRFDGCDLDDQTWNQDLAFAGSLGHGLDTLDLASASDTLCYELVKYLLPPAWFGWLDATRSPAGLLPDGDVCYWQKFSSMGNGYTFELESLIFWALVNVVCSNYGGVEARRAVYGDDIIVESRFTEPVVQLLEFIGFKVNKDKSFTGASRFRESCGKHYLDGHDVTPIYVRKHLDSLPTLVALHNQAILKGMVLYDGEFRCPYWAATSKLVADWIPRWARLKVPMNDGHTGLWSSFDEAKPTKAGNGHEGWRIRRLAVKPRTSKGDGEPGVIKSLYDLERAKPIRSFRDLVDSRISSEVPFFGKGPSYDYTISRGVVSKWCDLPPIFTH